MVDGARSGLHAALADTALQCRPGCARPGDQEVFIAQHHLTIGANVDKEGGLFLFIKPGGQQAADDVAAQVVGG